MCIRDSRFHLRVRFGLPAVIAPIALKIELPGGRQSDFWLSTRLFGTTESENEFACPHVGVFPVGVSQLTISDCFGLFAFRRSMRGAPQNVAVLPNPVQTAPLPVSPGEGENSSAQRAPVSYTHLDVYKRQTSGSSVASGSSTTSGSSVASGSSTTCLLYTSLWSLSACNRRRSGHR